MAKFQMEPETIDDLVDASVTRIRYDGVDLTHGEFILETTRGELRVEWKSGRVTVLEVLRG